LAAELMMAESDAGRRIHAFLEAMDRDRRALACAADLGRGWLNTTVEPPVAYRLRDLV